MCGRISEPDTIAIAIAPPATTAIAIAPPATTTIAIALPATIWQLHTIVSAPARSAR